MVQRVFLPVFQKIEIKHYDFGEVQNSIYAVHLNHLFPPLAMAWLHTLSREMVTKKTRESYSSDLVKFYNFLLSQTDLTEIKSLEDAKRTIVNCEALALNADRDLMERFGTYCEEIGNKKSTVGRAFAAISEFSKFFYEYGFTEHHRITKNTTRGILGKYKSTLGITTKVREMYISDDEFKEILLNQTWIKSKLGQARNELALRLRYYLGLRTFELIEHGNFEVSKLRKLLKEGKFGFDFDVFGKGEKKRTIYINSDLATDLNGFIKRYLKDYERGCIFTTIGKNKKPLKSKSFHKLAFNKSISYFLENNPDINQKKRNYLNNLEPYCLRHTFATNKCIEMIIKGEPYEILLKNLMGHESFQTTYNYIQTARLVMGSYPEKYTRQQFKHADLIINKVDVQIKSLREHVIK